MISHLFIYYLAILVCHVDCTTYLCWDASTGKDAPTVAGALFCKVIRKRLPQSTWIFNLLFCIYSHLKTNIADGSATQVSTCTSTVSSTFTCCSMSTSSYCNKVTQCFNALHIYDYTDDDPYCNLTPNGIGDYGCYVI